MDRFLGRFKVSSKIVSLLLLLSVVAIGVAVSAAITLRTVNGSYVVLTKKQLPMTTRLVRANRQMTSMLYASYRVLAYPGRSKEAHKAAQDAEKQYNDLAGTLRDAESLEPSSAGLMRDLLAQSDVIHGLIAQSLPLSLHDDNAGAQKYLVQADVKAAAFSKQIVALSGDREQAAAKAADDMSATTDRTSIALLTIAVVAAFAGLGSGVLVANIGITGPIAKLRTTMGTLASGNNHIDVPGVDRVDELGGMAKAVLVFRDAAVAKEAADAAKMQADAEQKMVVATLGEGLEKLSAGDLTADIRADFPPEYISLKANFNAALGALRDLIGAVADSAETIRTGSGEIAQASEDLARRTESNAASLEETSAAVTQMDGRLKATAEAASRTVGRADEAIATVSGGRSIADEAVQAMGRVSDSAKGIDGVIEGLDKIAFQTRVLAMNAAVEAGRAGDAGRGFAVVADLVSALAMRAEEEAKAARNQLTVTQTDIVTAVDAVRRVDSALADISEGVGEVHVLLGQMATDNQAQSSAITEISVAVGTMDQSTQQNAAMVEQTSAAARNLTSEVASLNERAARFITGAGTARPAPAKGRPVSSTQAAKKQYVSPVKPLPASISPQSGDWHNF